MKKNLVFLLASVFLCLISCSNFSNQNDFEVSDEALCTVSGTIGVNLSQINKAARTAVPEVDLISDSYKSLYYTIQAVRQSDSSEEEGTVTIGASAITYAISLPDGTWTITVNAYQTYDSDTSTYSNQIFKGSTSITLASQTITAGTTSVNLTGMTASTGAANLTVKISSDSGITSAKAFWTSGGASKSQTLALDSSTGVASDLEAAFTFSDDTDGNTSVSSGAYSVVFTFYKSSAVAYSFTETVNIFDNLKTEKWIDSVGAVYLTGGEVLVTKTLVDSYLLKTFYVDQTSGDDTSNPGDYFNPVKSVQRAVNLITAINDGSSEYTILLKSNVTASASTDFTTITNIGSSYISIAPSTALNLKIKSADSTNKTISATGNTSVPGRVMYIGAKANVTLENLNITGGIFATLVSTENIYTAIGAGVLVLGTDTDYAVCNINNCEIHDNSKNGTLVSDTKTAIGGGVTVNYGTLNINDSKIYSNFAKWGGGVSYYYDSVGTVSNCQIYENEAIVTGGGLWAQCASYNGDTVSLLIQKSKIENNKARSGAGLYNKGFATISASDIDSNQASGYGGGICANARTLIIENDSNVYSNSANVGGAIAVLSENGDTVINLKSCKIYDNSVTTGKTTGFYIGDHYAKDSETLVETITRASLKISDKCILNSDQYIYLGSYPIAIPTKDSTTFNQVKIDFGTLTGTADAQKFSVILEEYSTGTQIITAPDGLVSDYANRVTVLDSAGAASNYLVDSTGKLTRSMTTGGSITSTLVLDNTITFASDKSTISKASGGTITLSSSINGTAVTDLTATYTGFNVEVLNYGVSTGTTTTTGTVELTSAAIASWPAGSYSLYITGKYEGVDYNATLDFTLTE